MALKFHWASVPISVVIATLYFYYITRDKPGKKPKAGKGFDVVVHEKGTNCNLKAGKDDLVHLHYTGYLKSNGKMFESSREKSEPHVFKLGLCNEQGKPECIKGFEKGIMGMCVGEKRKITVPPHLGFGKVGRKPDVPPDDTLIFNVEMIDIDH